MTEKPRFRAKLTNDKQTVTLSDGYGNVVAGIGQGRDKASRGFYYSHTFQDQELINAYETSFLPRRIVDTMAEDATRRWRNWNADSDQITRIEKEELRVGVLKAVETAVKNARLLGGCYVYFPIRNQAPDTPFDVNSIGKGDLRRCIVFGQHQLTRGDLDEDFDSDTFGQPLFYVMSKKDGTQVRIHRSRLMVFRGDQGPLETHDYSMREGRSVLQTALAATKHVDGGIAAIATLIYEARIDVINVDGLMSQLSSRPDYEQILLKRFGMASMSKSVNGTLILDGKETYVQKSQTYGSLPEIMDRFFQYVSGSCGIPVTRLFGTSPGGMNATGESDIRHYYDRVQTIQNNEFTPELTNFDDALIRSALGRRPKKIFFTWRSLWQVSEKEKAEIAELYAQTGERMVKNGMIDAYSMGAALVNTLVENETMPGIESAWAAHQTIRSAPIEAVDPSKASATPRAGVPANENSSPAGTDSIERRNEQRANRRAVNDERPPRPLYVSRKVINTKEIYDWARLQGIEGLLDDLHVTILYTETPVNWMEMGEDYWFSEEEPNLTIPAGGARDVDLFGPTEDTLVIRFNSNRLRYRHEDLIERGATSTYPKYAPHISISKSVDGINFDKIKPYTGKIVLGPEIFEELKTREELEDA